MPTKAQTYAIGSLPREMILPAYKAAISLGLSFFLLRNTRYAIRNTRFYAKQSQFL